MFSSDNLQLLSDLELVNLHRQTFYRMESIRKLALYGGRDTTAYQENKALLARIEQEGANRNPNPFVQSAQG